MQEYFTNIGKIISLELNNDVIYAKVALLRSEMEIDDVRIVSSFGISGYPTIGSQCIVINTDCDTSRSYGLIIDLEHITSDANGIVIYGKNDNKLYFMDNGNIDIVSNKNKITLKGNSVEITGDVKITGNLEVSGNSTLTGTGTTIAGKNFLSHTHSGVTPGGGVSGGVA
jgi:phage gp45-like